MLELIRIFDGSFGGSTLYENKSYITPNTLRQMAKAKMQAKYQQRVQNKANKEKRDDSLPKDELEGIFN